MMKDKLVITLQVHSILCLTIKSRTIYADLDTKLVLQNYVGIVVLKQFNLFNSYYFNIENRNIQS